MRVVLKPISHPDIGEIVIEDSLFAVGRRETPFSAMEGAASQLSRRHARVFVEGGAAYVVDLGSTNGTQVDGRPLGTEPASLGDGNEIVFGSEISFRVGIEDDQDDATVVALPQTARLILSPEDSGLEPLVVENFPFLISRNDDWIQRHKDDYSEDIKEISRRHAIIVLKGARIYIEDLDSANGTYVSGERLDELAHALSDGDILSFGTSRFAYRVQVEQDGDKTIVASAADRDATRIQASSPAASERLSAQSDKGESSKSIVEEASSDQAEAEISQSVPHQSPTGEVDAISEVLGDPKTIYLNSNPTSFVNEVYAQQPAAAVEEVESTEEEAGDHRPVRRVAKARAVARELGSALEASPSTAKRVGIGVLLVVLLVGGALGTNYWLGADRRHVEVLLDEGAFAASADAAEAFLQRNPEDDQVDTWGAEALMNAVVPEWQRLIDQGDIQSAEIWLERSQEEHTHLKQGTQLLGMLSWATDVEAQMLAREDGPVSLFDEEQTVREIVEAWDSDPFSNRRLIGQLSDYVAAFEPSEARLMSALRTLQNDSSVYLNAIGELREDIVSRLNVGAVAEIRPLIREFEVRFPEVEGAAPLYLDVERYEELQALVEQKDLLSIRDFLGNGAFLTPVFAVHAETVLAEVMPPAEIVEQFESANELWRAGQLDDAMVAYQALTETKWGEVAQAEVERMRELMVAYRALERGRESADYTERLLAFHQLLKPGRDDFFLQTLKADLGQRQQALLSRLERNAEVARSEWSTFGSNGGIPGVLRLQKTLTDRFRSQAIHLTKALEAIVQATDGYVLTQSEPPSDWRALRTEIINEVARQRRALEDLKRVMEPALIDSKLVLIPKITEDMK